MRGMPESMLDAFSPASTIARSGVRAAHHGRPHEEAVLEARDAALGPVVARVVGVHEDVRARPGARRRRRSPLRRDTCRCRRRSLSGTRCPRRRASRACASPARPRASIAARRSSTLRRCCARAVIRLQARRSAGSGSPRSARASFTAGSPGSTPQRFAPTLISTSTSSVTPASRAAASSACTLSASSAHTATRACFASAASRRSFVRADHFVRDQHVGHAAFDQRFGLAHLLAAHADRAERHLAQRDLRALVALGVRAHHDLRLAERLRAGGAGCARRHRARGSAPACRLRRAASPIAAGG